MVSFECNPMYVEDVEDRSNTLKAVMLCMSKMSKMGKEHTDTFWLITSLIIDGFLIRKKFWKAETQLSLSFPTIPSNTVYIKLCRRSRR